MHRQASFCWGGWNNSPLLSPLLCPSCWKDCEWDAPRFTLLLRVNCASLSDARRHVLPVVYVHKSCHGCHQLTIYEVWEIQHVLDLLSYAKCSLSCLVLYCFFKFATIAIKWRFRLRLGLSTELLELYLTSKFPEEQNKNAFQCHLNTWAVCWSQRGEK